MKNKRIIKKLLTFSFLMLGLSLLLVSTIDTSEASSWQKWPVKTKHSELNKPDSWVQPYMTIGYGKSGYWKITGTVWGRNGGPRGKGVAFTGYHQEGRVVAIYKDYWGVSSLWWPGWYKKGNELKYLHRWSFSGSFKDSIL